MNRPYPAGAALTICPTESVPDSTRHRKRPLLRRVEASCHDADGRLTEFNRLAPATSFFENAFNAFARGTLLATPQGPLAIEDLSPGDLVETAEAGPEPVLWKGSITLYPLRADLPGRPDRLFRITADALGFGRPLQDLLLGPGAQIWSSRAGDFVAAEQLLDGETVVELLPPGPVTAYHICLGCNRTVLANGLAMRSYTPDVAAAAHLSSDVLALFRSLFPNIRELADFQSLPSPRLTDRGFRSGSAVA